MPGFLSMANLVNEVTVQGKLNRSGFSKVGVTGTAGVWQSLARLGGHPVAIADGAAGSGTPGAGGTALTLAAGTTNWPNVSTDLRFLTGATLWATQPCTLMIYDRLTHTSGLSVAALATLNVGSAVPPRYNNSTPNLFDSAGGNECWLEVTTATLTTAPVVNLASYTDNSGNTAQVGGNFTFPAAATVVQSLVGPLPLAGGDRGLKSVETLTVSTASAAGAVQLVILRPIAFIPMVANISTNVNFVLQMMSLPRLIDGHSLSYAILMPATTATTVGGTLTAAFG